MNSLDDLKALLTPAKRHLLDKAYELGKSRLEEILLPNTTADLGFFANLPELHRSFAMQYLIMELLSFQIPNHVHALKGVDKMHIKRMQAQNTTDRAILRDMLLRSVKFSDNTDPNRYMKLLMDEMAAQLWEAFDVLSKVKRPDQAVAVLKLHANGEVFLEGSEVPLIEQEDHA